MKKALLVALLLLPLAAGAADAKLRPSLHPVRLSPPVFRGSGFRPREHVTVSLRILPAAKVHVVANAHGRFRVRLAAVPACGAWRIRAVGSHGSRAVYRHRVCAAASTGVEGVVLRGPTQPVCTAESACTPPASGVTVQASQNGDVIATTTTNADGRFTLPLASGDYTIQALGRDTQP